MSDRVKILTKETSIEIIIAPLRSKKFLIFSMIFIILQTAVLILTIQNTTTGSVIFPICLWCLGSGVILYLQACNSFGKVIVTLDQKNISIKDEVKWLGLTKKFPIKDVSNIRVAGFYDKISTPMLTGWLQFKFYDGKVAFDYQNKTYRFGSSISNNEAIKIAEKFKNFVKAVQYNS